MEEEIKQIREEIKAIHNIALQNKKATETNAEDIKDNFEKINQNTFVVDIIKDYKNEVETLKDIVKTNKKTIKIMFIILIIMLILLGVVCVHHFIIE